MSQESNSQFQRWEALSLAAALTILAITLPSSRQLGLIYLEHIQGLPWLSYPRFADLVLIAMGLILVLPCPRASGLCIGKIREHWKGVLLMTGGPLLLTAIVYPQLDERPFRGSDLRIWLTSPLAQDLIFGGVLYRILRPHFSTHVHRRLRMEWALPVGDYSSPPGTFRTWLPSRCST